MHAKMTQKELKASQARLKAAMAQIKELAPKIEAVSARIESRKEDISKCHRAINKVGLRFMCPPARLPAVGVDTRARVCLARDVCRSPRPSLTP